MTNEVKTMRGKARRLSNNKKLPVLASNLQQTLISTPVAQIQQNSLAYSINDLQSNNIATAQQNQFYNNPSNFVIAASQKSLSSQQVSFFFLFFCKFLFKVINNPSIQQQKIVPIQPVSQPVVYTTSPQVNILNSAQQPLQISQSNNTQFIPLKQMSFSTSKKGRGLAAKYQELQKQFQEQQQLKESQLLPPQTITTTVELHPLLVGQITPQQLAQIIPTANLAPNSSSTIIVDFNGQQLPINVRTTVLSANNTSIVENSVNKTSGISNSVIQPNLIQPILNHKNIAQNNTSIKELNQYDHIFNDLTTYSSNSHGNINAVSSSYARTTNLRQKRNNSNRSSSVTSNLFSASLTPTQSTSFDLDDTIESVCQQASLAAAASSRINTAPSISVAAALQNSRSQVRRKPRSKTIYNGKFFF